MSTFCHAVFSVACLSPALIACPTTQPESIVPQRTLPGDSVVYAIIRQQVDSKRSTGIVVGLVDADGKRRVVAYGARTPNGAALNGQSVFEIGSVTKVFTGTLLADMMLRGEVRLDDPVQRFLPAGVRVPTRAGRQITLLDLATQSSGLPRLPGNFTPRQPDNPYADYSVQQLYDFLSGYTLPRDIGSRYEYSNLGVGLLGHALALRAGTSYEALLTERVLAPLGMQDTRITLTPELRERFAAGHDEAGKEVSPWDLPTLAGAGALRSTANDLLTFVAANLDTTRQPLGRAFALAHAPRMRTDDPSLRVGLTWHVIEAFGRTVVWHNGGTGGYHAFIGFGPAAREGVVVLSSSTTSIDDIGFHLLDERAPLEQAPKARVEVNLDPALLRAYAGDYQLTPTFHLVISRERSGLFVQATGQQKFQLFAESETRFFLKAVDAQITFVKDALGRVTQLVLHQGGQDQVARKVR